MIIITPICFAEDRVLLTIPPSNFLVKAEVVAILPFINDKVLLLQRLPTHPQANLWCPPGGKLQAGETTRQAAIRELSEETGIEVEEEALMDLGKFYVRYPNGDFVFYLYSLCLQQIDREIEIRKHEHQSYCLCPVKEVNSLPLTPGLDECFKIAENFKTEILR